jgi:hypothetical protein
MYYKTMYLWSDYVRFCGAHSWYKHLPVEGKDIQFYYEKDRSSDEMHWQFTNEPPDDPNNEVYTVRLGPFIHGEACNKRYNEYSTCSVDIIIRRAKERGTWEPWIAANYPHLVDIDWDDTWMNSKSRAAVHEIYRKECRRYWDDIVEASKNASSPRF